MRFNDDLKIIPKNVKYTSTGIQNEVPGAKKKTIWKGIAEGIKKIGCQVLLPEM